VEISVIIGVISEIVVDSCELRWRRGHRAESRRDFGFRDLGIEGLRAKSKEQRSEDGEQRMPRETNLNILFLNPAISTCTISGYGKTRHD